MARASRKSSHYFTSDSHRNSIGGKGKANNDNKPFERAEVEGGELHLIYAKKLCMQMASLAGRGLRLPLG